MTNSRHLDGQLADYLAGRLAEADAEALEAHAGSCERCGALLEAATRLELDLSAAVAPPPEIRAAVLGQLHPRRLPTRRWLVPAAIAATLVIGFALTRPTPKSAMIPRSANPAAIAASRADGEFDRLATARREVEAALRVDPGNGELEAALVRLDDQRRRLERLVMEFES